MVGKIMHVILVVFIIITYTSKKTQHATEAKKQLGEVKALLTSKDKSLAKCAQDHIPKIPTTKKDSTTTSRKRAATSSNNNNNNKHDNDSNSNSRKKSKHGNNNNDIEKLLSTYEYNSTNPNEELAQREVRAMKQLAEFILENDGTLSMIEEYRARATKKGVSTTTGSTVVSGNSSAGTTTTTTTNASRRYDINYFNENQRRFRSMLEIGRYLKLTTMTGGHHHPHSSSSSSSGQRSNNNNKGSSSVVRKRKTTTSREQQAEKKRLRKELEKLRKAHQRATKALDDFVTKTTTTEDNNNDEHNKEDSCSNNNKGDGDHDHHHGHSNASGNAAGRQYPIDDRVLMEEEEEEAGSSSSSSSSLLMVASHRAQDVTTLHVDIPNHCIPDVIMMWDFLNTFHKVLSLSPVECIDDFVHAITYKPPTDITGDDMSVPPVYVAEMNLSLIKLLLSDPTSDTWWWSIFETDQIVDPNFTTTTTTTTTIDDDPSSLATNVTTSGNNNNTTTTTKVEPTITKATAAAVAGASISATTTHGSHDDDDDDEYPPIRIDMASLLAESEDVVRTMSWLRSLEDIIKHQQQQQRISGSKTTKASIRKQIRTTMKVVTNKWVLAYLRKAIDAGRSSSSSSSKVANGGTIQFTIRAVDWFVRRIRRARPDLDADDDDNNNREEGKDGGKLGGDDSQENLYKARATVVQEVAKEMESIPSSLLSSIPTVNDQDVLSDDDDDNNNNNNNNDRQDEDDDDDSDESDDEQHGCENDHTADQEHQDDSKREASTIPAKPLLTFVEMLLPPEKPSQSAEFINVFTWSHLVGAVAHRVLHRKKRIRNEADDAIRAANQLPPLLVPQRLQRERSIARRILGESCVENITHEDPTDDDVSEQAIQHLCCGGKYIDLTPIQRLCLLRLLIEAAYDTDRLHKVVESNYEQRVNAMKALGVEQRRAKKAAKEMAQKDEASARERLASDARDRFFDEKREEIRQLNEKSKEFGDDVIESLTEEDILDFDEDFQADYETLPQPDSFNKTEVHNMVSKMKEYAAFETDTLRVLTLEELVEREKRELEEMEGQILGFGGEDALNDPSLDRETGRSIERLQRDIAKAKQNANKLPDTRARAIVQLKDAIEAGTIKALRAAFTAAKKAKLTGPDEETGGKYAVDVLRDAALELENANHNKRLLNAQKELVAKRNKCFIRTSPLGRDRVDNRFWTFDNDERCHVWVETQRPLLKDEDAPTKPPPEFMDLARKGTDLVIGANDMEEDLNVPKNEAEAKEFIAFSRREYHSTGFSSSLVDHHWGCHTTEDSLRPVLKSLDSRGIRESDLKGKLKEALEEAVGSDDKNENSGNKDDSANGEDDDDVQENTDDDGLRNSGDEELFQSARDTAIGKDESIDDALGGMVSAMGQNVRIRRTLEQSKDNSIARYEDGTVTGWKTRRVEVENDRGTSGDKNDSDDEGEGDDTEPTKETIETPVWRIQTDRGHIFWLAGVELIESLCRHQKARQSSGYFEHDAAFLAYRNSMGRHCGGKASEAPYASSPFSFAKLMLKKEGELYPKLKMLSYDNSWGGKSGSRALWMNSMKDYAYDFETVRQGLLTLENAFFELTGEFDGNANGEAEISNVVALLDDPVSRVEIELESIEKSVRGLWNSPTSRAVFIHIVSTCKTTGFLALALDLICRNTSKYLQKNKPSKTRASTSSSSYLSRGVDVDSVIDTPRGKRTTRRKNAWQQQQQQRQLADDDDDDDDDDDEDNMGDDDDDDEDWR